MAWFLGQSWIFLLLAFLLGLLVGWLIWGRSHHDCATAAKNAEPRTATKVTPVVATPPAAQPAVAQPETASEPVPAEVIAEPEPAPAAVTEPVNVVEPVVEPVPAATPVPDNLQRIEGIGPKIAGTLAAAGIVTFGQLAAADQPALVEVLRQGGVRFAPSMSTWPRQAELLANGDEAGFTLLTSQLTAGRRAR